MKFLVMVLPLPLPVPPEQGVDLHRAALAWINERLEDGRMDCCYVFANGGGVAISNAESHEQLFDEIVSYPLHPFYRFEVEPLCDVAHTLRTTIGIYSSGGR
jgi:hypothetical protein